MILFGRKTLDELEGRRLVPQLLVSHSPRPSVGQEDIDRQASACSEAKATIPTPLPATPGLIEGVVYEAVKRLEGGDLLELLAQEVDLRQK